MRKKIAEHMVLSKRTSAHVYSVFEVNFQRVDADSQGEEGRVRARRRQADLHVVHRQGRGRRLRRHPVINASIDGDNIIYKKRHQPRHRRGARDGLIVPVVKGAGEKNTARAVARHPGHRRSRARAKKLNPEEVQGGTFTITNPGNFGAQFGLPIINQPQVAILGVGTIEKRAVVIDDAIGIRLMGYLTLGYDHRLVDGAVADQFMADVKKGIEKFDAS